MNYRTIFTISASLLAAGLIQSVSAKSITTTDGQVYNDVSVIRVEPDGYLVNYQPAPNSLGIAKIKFTRLTKEQQIRGGYEPGEAREFELATAQASDDYARTINQWNETAKAARQAREAWQVESATRLRLENEAKFRAQENTPASTTTYASSGGWTYYGGGLFLVPVPQMGTSGKIDNTRAKIFTAQDKMPPRKAGKYSF